MRNASGFKSPLTEIATRPRESPPEALRIAAAPNSLTGSGTRLMTSVAAFAVSASSSNMPPAAGNERLMTYRCLNILGIFEARRLAAFVSRRGGRINNLPHKIPQGRKLSYRHDKLCSAERILTRCGRSEEHTSELQSLRHLVCRL